MMRLRIILGLPYLKTVQALNMRHTGESDCLNAQPCK